MQGAALQGPLEETNDADAIETCAPCRSVRLVRWTLAAACRGGLTLVFSRLGLVTIQRSSARFDSSVGIFATECHGIESAVDIHDFGRDA